MQFITQQYLTLNFWSLINSTPLEAGSLEIVVVGKEAHTASISSLERLLLSLRSPASHKSKSQHVWKLPRPVRRKYRNRRAAPTRRTEPC